MPDPARVGDATSDGGAVTGGCDTVLIQGAHVSRENDAVETPTIGKGAIAQHARTVEVGGRLIAFTGHQCRRGSPGEAGAGLPDVLSMTSAKFLLAELSEARRRMDAGEVLPEQQMSASPEPRQAPEYKVGTPKKDASGVTTQSSSYGELKERLVDNGQVTLDRTRNAGVFDTRYGLRGGSVSATGFTDSLTLTSRNASLTGGYDLGVAGVAFEGGPPMLSGPRIGYQGEASFQVALARIFGQGSVEVSALQLTTAAYDYTAGLGSTLLGFPTLSDKLKSYFPSLSPLDQATVRVDVEADLLIGGAGEGIKATALVDTEKERIELGLGGKPVIGGAEVLLSFGRRTKKDGDKEVEEVFVTPAPNTVIVEGGYAAMGEAFALYYKLNPPK